MNSPSAERARFCFERRVRHKFYVSCALSSHFILCTLLDLAASSLSFLVRVQRMYMENFQLFVFDVGMLLCLGLRCLFRVCTGATSATQLCGG